ncbi:MAG: TIGR02996 domain-containing protein [Myxococcus sp.]|nr:TIGR02996 domain-containing protein [Myxococcus sp.]
MSSEVGQRSAFEAAIKAAPDDASGYAVLGDWLSQRGDPRGELIALQQQPALDRRQREREKALLMEPSIRCLAGPLAQWRWGFVHTAILVRPASPGRTSGAGLGALLAHPSMRFVRALTLGQEPLAESLEALAASAPRVLASLSLYSPRPLELGQLPRGLPALEHLHLSTPEVSGVLGALPGLTALTVSFLEWGPSTGKALLDHNRAQLSRIKVVAAGVFDARSLDAVLALPALEHLTLEASELNVEVIDAIAGSAAASRLTTLDLARSGLSERGARRMLELAPGLPRLSNLVMGEAADP